MRPEPYSTCIPGRMGASYTCSHSVRPDAASRAMTASGAVAGLQTRSLRIVSMLLMGRYIVKRAAPSLEMAE